jgi:hypothetical protein
MGKNRTNRGGYRQPSKPAAASGPGGLSERTDGGPGSAKIPLKQPIRRLPNADYGANKKFVSDQELVNGLPAQGPIPTDPLPAEGNNLDIFAATELQGQSATSGGVMGQGVGIEALAEGQDDVDILLNVLEFRNPNNLYIKQLINTRNKEINNGYNT